MTNDPRIEAVAKVYRECLLRDPDYDLIRKMLAAADEAAQDRRYLPEDWNVQAAE